jgi:hypothetical protein
MIGNWLIIGPSEKDNWSIDSASLPMKVSSVPIKVGDYIRFGQYREQPILWRVIHLDRDGDPVLFSDKIITIKYMMRVTVTSMNIQICDNG